MTSQISQQKRIKTANKLGLTRSKYDIIPIINILPKQSIISINWDGRACLVT